MPETEAEQDNAIRALVESKLADMEAQQDDEDEDNLSNSSDEDNQPIPWLPPWAHNREASGSSLAPPQPP